MRLALWGAIDGTGACVIDRALADGHQVIAIVRDVKGVAPREGLKVLTGDLLDAASIESALAGVDAVVGTMTTVRRFGPRDRLSRGTKNVVAACKKLGIKRFVFKSELLMSDGTEMGFFERQGLRLTRFFSPRLRMEKLLAEQAIMTSGIDWVIIRAPRLFDGKAVGHFVAAPRARVSALSRLAHADCARVMMKAVNEASWVKQVINLGRA